MRLQPVTLPAVAVAISAVGHYLLDTPLLPPGGLWPGALAVVLGVGFAMWAVMGQFQQGTHPEVTHATTALVTTGPYAMSRNPIYVGFLLIQAGVGLMTGMWIALVLLPATWWGLHHFVVLREEAELARVFGEAYERYVQRTRRWL